MKRFSILCTIVVFLNSCSSRVKVTVIDQFDKEIISTIHPKEKGTYSTYRVEIEGEVNDSVMFKFRESGFPFYFTGKVDYSIRVDYYGGFPKKFIFKPYKATKGKITITQKLL